MMSRQKDKSSNIIRVVSINEIESLEQPGFYKVEGFEDATIEKINDLSELKNRGLYIIDDDEITVKTRIPQVLKEKGLIASDLAKLTGISRQNINAVVKNNMKPGIDFALKTSFVLGKSVEELFELTANAWIKPFKIGSDISVFIDVIHHIILDNRIKKALLQQDPSEFIELKTGKRFTKQEHDALLRTYISDNKDKEEERIKKTNPKLSLNKIKSMAIKNLQQEFRLNYSRIYKRLGEKIQPYVLKAVKENESDS